VIKIAVVDDEQKEQKLLMKLFRKLSEEVQEEIQVNAFESGETLLEGYDYSWDLICLDIQMKGQDGIGIAKQIRSMDEQVILIFVTNMAQMAIKGYEVQAMDFLVKPVSYYPFALKMRNIVNIINNKKSRNIVLHTSDGWRKILSDNIYFAEVDRHYVSFYTNDGVFRQKSSLRELESKLEGLSFKRCNNCYLVNLKYVDAICKDDLKIAGKWLRISRLRKKEFLHALANYMGGLEI